jgi:hypothetical protein
MEVLEVLEEEEPVLDLDWVSMSMPVLGSVTTKRAEDLIVEGKETSMRCTSTIYMHMQIAFLVHPNNEMRRISKTCT